jgi:hypothetical protein
MLNRDKWDIFGALVCRALPIHAGNAAMCRHEAERRKSLPNFTNLMLKNVKTESGNI